MAKTERERILLQLGDIISYVKKMSDTSPFFGLGRIGIEIEKDKDGNYHLYVDPQGGEYHEEGKYSFCALVQKITDLAYEEIDKAEKENIYE